MNDREQQRLDAQRFAEEALGARRTVGAGPPPGTAAGDLLVLWRRCQEAGLPEAEFTRLARAVWATYHPADDRE